MNKATEERLLTLKVTVVVIEGLWSKGPSHFIAIFDGSPSINLLHNFVLIVECNGQSSPRGN